MIFDLTPGFFRRLSSCRYCCQCCCCCFCVPLLLHVFLMKVKKQLQFV